MHRNTRFFVSPCRKFAAWLHPLDLQTGHYPQYDNWIDVTDLNDDEFEEFMMKDHIDDEKISIIGEFDEKGITDAMADKIIYSYLPEFMNCEIRSIWEEGMDILADGIIKH